MKSSLAALLLFLSSLSTSGVLPQSLSHPFTSTTTTSTSYGDMIRTPVVVSKVEDTTPGRPLAVSLPSPHTTTNTVVPLTVTGGSAPYTYTTSAGSLARVSIGSPEVFLRAPTKPGKVIVTITDKIGDTRQVSIQVSTRLSIPSSVVTLTPSTTYVIKPLGGSSPYT